MLLKRSLLNKLMFQFDSGGDMGGLFDFGGDTGAVTGGSEQTGGALQTGPLGNQGGGGIFDLFGGGGGGAGGFDIGKLLPSLLGGGAGLFGFLRNQGGAGDKALQNQTQATKDVQAAGGEALQAYRTGTLLPYQQTEKNKVMAETRAKLEQYYANAGIPVGSAQADIEGQVQQAGAAYDARVYQQNFNNAMAATGMSVNNLTNVARQQAQQDAAQRDEWAGFMEELGKITGGIFGGGGDQSQQEPGTIYD